MPTDGVKGKTLTSRQKEFVRALNINIITTDKKLKQAFDNWNNARSYSDTSKQTKA